MCPLGCDHVAGHWQQTVGNDGYERKSHLVKIKSKVFWTWSCSRFPLDNKWRGNNTESWTKYMRQYQTLKNNVQMTCLTKSFCVNKCVKYLLRNLGLHAFFRLRQMLWGQPFIKVRYIPTTIDLLHSHVYTRWHTCTWLSWVQATHDWLVSDAGWLCHR